MLIVIIGPDGSGKTTLAKSIFKNYKNKFKEIKLFEFRYGVLPTLSFFINYFKNKNSINFKEKNYFKKKDRYLSGMNHPKNFLNGLILIIWYSLEHLIYKINYYSKNKKSFLHIFARYSHDYVYMRSYRNMPLFIRFIPFFVSKKPDFVFSIKRDSFDIFVNKPELTTEEIERQQQIIKKYFSKKTNFHFLNPDSINSKTINTVLEIINKRI